MTQKANPTNAHVENTIVSRFHPQKDKDGSMTKWADDATLGNFPFWAVSMLYDRVCKFRDRGDHPSSSKIRVVNWVDVTPGLGAIGAGIINVGLKTDSCLPLLVRRLVKPGCGVGPFLALCEFSRFIVSENPEPFSVTADEQRFPKTNMLTLITQCVANARRALRDGVVGDAKATDKYTKLLDHAAACVLSGLDPCDEVSILYEQVRGQDPSLIRVVKVCAMSQSEG